MANLDHLKKIIEKSFEERNSLNSNSEHTELRAAVMEVIQGLEAGILRVSERISNKSQKNEDQNTQNTWITHQWIKKAVLLYFRLHNSTPIPGGFTQFFDKVPPRFGTTSEQEFQNLGVRIVPPTLVRSGAFVGPNTILMPSLVNIGAYIDSGTMVDTWATVGSCAQIGKNVHLSGGVGIGGVLEPLQANPTIIEDNCFIGARSEIVEGVIVEEGAVISMGVYIGQSTRIYNRETGEITMGRIPKRSVVVPGNLPSSDGKYSLYCAVIVKQVDEKTREKTAINDLLRL